MAQPSLTKWDLGRDKHGRTVSLFREFEGGVAVWRLHREPVNQRDDVARLDGLTTDMILAMAGIATTEKGRG